MNARQGIASDWFVIANAESIASPALLLYPDRIEQNLQHMIAMAGGVDRLRPHVKTHKLPQVIALKRAAGIHKFKVSTIAEAEMTAAAGGEDILLAYQPVGPNVERLVDAVRLPCINNPTLLPPSHCSRSAMTCRSSAEHRAVGMGFGPGRE